MKEQRTRLTRAMTYDGPPEWVAAQIEKTRQGNLAEPGGLVSCSIIDVHQYHFDRPDKMENDTRAEPGGTIESKIVNVHDYEVDMTMPEPIAPTAADKPSFTPYIGQWVKHAHTKTPFKVARIGNSPKETWLYTDGAGKHAYLLDNCTPWTPQWGEKAQWDGVRTFCPGEKTPRVVIIMQPNASPPDGSEYLYSFDGVTAKGWTTLTHLSPVIEQKKPAEPPKPVTTVLTFDKQGKQGKYVFRGEPDYPRIEREMLADGYMAVIVTPSGHEQGHTDLMAVRDGFVRISRKELEMYNGCDTLVRIGLDAEWDNHAGMARAISNVKKAIADWNAKQPKPEHVAGERFEGEISKPDRCYLSALHHLEFTGEQRRKREGDWWLRISDGEAGYCNFAPDDTTPWILRVVPNVPEPETQFARFDCWTPEMKKQYYETVGIDGKKK